MLLGTGNKCWVVGIKYQNSMHDNIPQASRVPKPVCRQTVRLEHTPSSHSKTELFKTSPVMSGSGKCVELDEAASIDLTRWDMWDAQLVVSGAVWLSLSSPFKTVTSYSNDGVLHNGWTTMVRFLTGEQILSSDYHVMENSRAQDSFQWCQRFLTEDYSSQSKMLTSASCLEI